MKKVEQSFQEFVQKGLIFFFLGGVGQGRNQEFVQRGLKFFSFQGGVTTRWGMKTPWNQ